MYHHTFLFFYTSNVTPCSIFVEVPCHTLLAQHQHVVVKPVYPDADIAKGPEAKGLLHNRCIDRTAIDGVALNEETVALMLEVAKHLSLGRANPRS